MTAALKRLLRMKISILVALATVVVAGSASYAPGGPLDPAIFTSRPWSSDRVCLALLFILGLFVLSAGTIHQSYKASLAADQKIHNGAIRKKLAKRIAKIQDLRGHLDSLTSRYRTTIGENTDLRHQVEGLQSANSFIIENMRELVEVYLDNLIENHKETSFDLAKTRISVYQYEAKLNFFALLGRHSNSPDWKRSSKRVYQGGKGIVARAWSDGDALLASLPDPIKSPGEYAALQADFNLLPHEVEELRMKPRFYYAKRIESPRSRKSIGVVVVESLSPRWASKSELEQLFTPSGRWLLPDLMDKLEPLIPSLDDAAKEGFN